MKKLNFETIIKILLPLACVVMAVLLFASCSDDIDISQTTDDETETTESKVTPTIDSLKVKTRLKTYVFPSSYTNTGKALTNRVINPATTLDTTVQTVVLHDNSVAGLATADYARIVTLIARGGSVVYCSPTSTGVHRFISNLRTAGADLERQSALQFTDDGFRAYYKLQNMKTDKTSGLFLPPFLADNETNEILCDIFAFRAGNHYIVADMDEGKTVRVSVSDNADDTPTEDSPTEEVTDIPMEYMCGLHADGLAEWLDTPEDEASSQAKGRDILRQNNSGAPADLATLNTAEITSFTFNAYAGSDWEKVKVTYEIWSVYTPKGEGGQPYDYYLIHQTVVCPNSHLKCGPDDSEKRWYKISGKDFPEAKSNDRAAYTAYMWGLSNQATFSDKSVQVEQVSPTNDTSTGSTYTAHLTLSLETAFIGSLKPHVDLKSGIKMEKSWSRTLPDLDMTEYYNGNKPKWVYKGGNAPKIKWNGTNVRPYHTFAPKILKNDVTLEHSWIWRAKNPKGSYSFTTNINVDLQGLWYTWYDKKYSYGRDSGYKTFSTPYTYTYTITAPPRYKQDWVMESSPYNKNLSEYMAEHFPEEWLPSFSLYTSVEDDTLKINSHIDNVIKVLEAKKGQLKRAGFTKFTVSWSKKNESAVYKSYTCTPE